MINEIETDFIKIKGFKQFNLILGKNGSGKTSLLKEILSQNEEESSAFVPKIARQEFVDFLEKSTLEEKIEHITSHFSLSLAEKSILLIDEVGKNFHYEVIYKLWEYLFLLGERRNIQIFAVTHSKDCLLAFVKESEKLGVSDKIASFRLQRNKLDSLEAVDNDYSVLVDLLEGGMELR